MMRSDLSVYVAVRGALRTVLGPVATQIVVKAQDGVVSLSGAVSTSEEKLAAEHAVQCIPGVHAVVEALTVAAGPPAAASADQTLAQQAVAALANGLHPIGRDVTIRVEHGWLTLSGTVASAVEYSAVERALESLPGARGMTSEVRIVPEGATPIRSPVAPPVD